MPAHLDLKKNANQKTAIQQKGNLLKSPLEGSVVNEHLVGFHNNNGNQQQQQSYEVNEQQQLNQYLIYPSNLLQRCQNSSRTIQQRQLLEQQQCQNSPIQYINRQSPSISIDLPIQILTSCIEWAKSVPLFNALPATDQISLLCSSWSELYILTSSQYCACQGINAKTFSRLTRINRQFKSPSHEHSMQMLEEIIDKFKSMNTDTNEFSCLKALALFNPDTPRISNATLIEHLQDKAQTELEDYLRQNPSHPFSCRYGKLLLRLPALSLIQADTMETMFFDGNLGNFSVVSFIRSIITSANDTGF
ncbi:COUP transcription factor 1-like [Clytia hemisphaerica]|uniref:COUP transcription factor 1-like n=1 Tax=Clytia hemisphaerica TaxID=252671 RepID=UPI0034D4423F